MVLLDLSSQCAPVRTAQTGTETFFDEVDSAFSGQNSADSLTGGLSDASTAGLGTDAQAGTNPGALNPVGSANSLGYTVGQGMSTGESEGLGDGASNHFNQMAFSIEKVTVTAKSRALKASTPWNWHKTSRRSTV